jgi:hypothetical protein
MSDSDKSNNSENKNNFWATFPGVLTAVGGFLVAITGLITVLQSMGIVKKLPQTPPPVASSPTPVTQTPSASQATTSTQSPIASSESSTSKTLTSTQSPIASSKSSMSKTSTSTQSPIASSKSSTSKTPTSTQSPTASSESSTSKTPTSTQSPIASSESSANESSIISSSETSSSKPSAFLAKSSSVPEITIDSLKDKSEVKSSENITGQLAGEVPSGESLWLYVYDTNSNKYTYHPISVSGESWKAEDSVVFGEGDRATNSEFKVGVVLADAEISKQIENESSNRTSQLGKLISEEIVVNRTN